VINFYNACKVDAFTIPSGKLSSNARKNHRIFLKCNLRLDKLPLIVIIDEYHTVVIAEKYKNKFYEFINLFES